MPDKKSRLISMRRFFISSENASGKQIFGTRLISTQKDVVMKMHSYKKELIFMAK